MLDFFFTQVGLLGDFAKSQNPIASRSTEDGLNKGHQANLLPEERVIVLEDGLKKE